MTQRNFKIQKWSVWPPLPEDGGSPSDSQIHFLSTIPKSLKRRLSPLAKLVFSAADSCVDKDNPTPNVLSSSHGELAKTFKMMKLLHSGEEISPTAFSLSVHNAIAGLFAMAQHNKLQSTVIAPGEEGMAPAFIEALGLLIEGAKQVLVVFYDQPLVDFYPSAPYKLATDESCALALRISNSGEGLGMHFSNSPLQGDSGEQPWQLPQFIQFLNNSSQQLILKSSRHAWCWEKY